MKVFVFTIFFLLFTCYGDAQEDRKDMIILKSHIVNGEAMAKSSEHYYPTFQKTYNPLKLILFLPLYGYQRMVSEQISAVCGFEPSCSGFSVIAIKKLGIIRGLFLTADRLTRCNGETQTESEYYLFDTRKSKVFDDPDMYRFKKNN